MRHKKKGQKLSRDKSQRKALLKSLVSHLFIYEEIRTTLSKAKAIKGLADRLISRVGKTSSLQCQRLIEAFLQNKNAVEKLFQEIGPRFKEKKGGFTRVVRVGKRRGDGAVIAKVELIEKGEEKKEKKKTKEKKTDKKSS